MAAPEARFRWVSRPRALVPEIDLRASAAPIDVQGVFSSSIGGERAYEVSAGRALPPGLPPPGEIRPRPPDHFHRFRRLASQHASFAQNGSRFRTQRALFARERAFRHKPFSDAFSMFWARESGPISPENAPFGGIWAGGAICARPFSALQTPKQPKLYQRSVVHVLSDVMRAALQRPSSRSRGASKGKVGEQAAFSPQNGLNAAFCAWQREPRTPPSRAARCARALLHLWFSNFRKRPNWGRVLGRSNFRGSIFLGGSQAENGL